MSDPSAAHVRLKPPMSFVCTHCGESVHMVPPMPAVTLAALADAFIGLHRDCAPPMQPTEGA